MGKISSQEIANALMERRQLSKKQASQFVNEMFYVIQKALDEEKLVKVKGLGTFRIIDVEDRESVNVNTGDRVLIEGHGKITFTPDTLMKELVNKPFSQFETVVLNEGVDFGDLKAGEEPAGETAVADTIEEPAVSEVVEKPAVFDTVEEPAVSEAVEEPAVSDTVEEPAVSLDGEPAVSEAVEEPVTVSTAESSVVSETTDSPAGADEVEESPVVETAAESPEEQQPAETEPEPAQHRLKWPLIVLAAFAIAFVAGFFVGKGIAVVSGESEQASTVKPLSVQSKVEASSADTPKRDTAVVSKAMLPDSMPKPARQDNPIRTVEAPSHTAEAPVKPAEALTTAQTGGLDEYEKKDARVRTGAYRIVGLDHTEKIRASDNLARICKRTLGPGMECYLEVYNGIKGDADLKAGQEIKIPKLKWKRKKAQK